MRRLLLLLLLLLSGQHDLQAQDEDSVLVTRVVWSPDGNLLAVGTLHGVTVYDASHGFVQRLWSVDTSANGGAGSLLFSPNGQWVLSGVAGSLTTTTRGMVNIWESRTGQLIRTFEGNPISVYALAFSPNERWLAVGGGSSFVPAEDYVRFYDTQTWMEDPTRRLEGIGAVYAVAYSADGRWFAFGSEYGEIYLIDVARWTPVAAIHQWYPWTISFTSDSSHLWLNEVEEWELQEAPEIHLVLSDQITVYPSGRVPAAQTIIAATPDHYATVTNDGAIRIYRNEAEIEFMHVADGVHFADGAFNPQQTQLALTRSLYEGELRCSVQRNNCVSLWTFATGEFTALDAISD